MTKLATRILATFAFAAVSIAASAQTIQGGGSYGWKYAGQYQQYSLNMNASVLQNGAPAGSAAFHVDYRIKSGSVISRGVKHFDRLTVTGLSVSGGLAVVSAEGYERNDPNTLYRFQWRIWDMGSTGDLVDEYRLSSGNFTLSP
jgi:hypothetical protein